MHIQYRMVIVNLQLLLLVIFTVRCWAIEYYVTPINGGNATCPLSQICLTINQYTDPSNNYLRHNNTVFTFLPGKHVMERPMEFNNVENITLQALQNNNDTYPELVPRYYSTCKKEFWFFNSTLSLGCSFAIKMKETVNVTISGLTIITSFVNISGISIQNSTNIQILQNTIYSNDTVGIYISESVDIYIESLKTRNAAFGVIMVEVYSIMILKSLFNESFYSGIYANRTDCIKLLNIESHQSEMFGIWVFSTIHSLFENIYVSLNNLSGISVAESTNTTMLNISSMNNQDGIVLDNSNDTTMINISSMNNQANGIWFKYSTDAIMINVSSTNNQRDGIVLAYSTNITMINVSSMNTQGNGIVLGESTDTTMINVSSMNNSYIGIQLLFSTGTTMINVSSMNNQDNGIGLDNSTNTTMINVSSMNNQNDGIWGYPIAITMINVSSMNNKVVGIHLFASTDTTMINVSSMNNQKYGISLESSTNTTMMNISSMNNEDNGFVLLESNNTTIINILSVNNRFIGIYVRSCTATTMKNISSTNFAFDNSIATNMTNVILVFNHNFDISDLVQTKVALQNCSHSAINNMSIAYENVHHNLMALFNCADILLEEITFSNIDAVADLQQPTPDVADLPAVITLYNTHLTLRNCNFTSNKITSIAATSSNITVKDNVLFETNSAFLGAVFILSKSSVVTVSEQSNVVFRNNSVSQYGAVFYIITDNLPETSIHIHELATSTGSFITLGTKCFIQVEGDRSDISRLTFINNTAVEGGDVLYGGLVAAGYDGDWNCLLSFKNISDMTGQSSEKEFRRISSAPSRVCLCNDSSPDCLVVVDPTTHTLYPGEALTVSAALIGQDFGTVSGFVYGQLLMDNETNIILLEQSCENGMCKKLNYILNSTCEECEAVLVLTSDGRKVSELIDITENQRLNRSWSILQSEPDYHALAWRYVQKFIIIKDFIPHISRKYDDFANSLIENFFVLSPEPLPKLSIDHHSLKSIFNKLRFPKQIYTYPLYINIKFRPCPLGFTLSQSQCDCNHLLHYMPAVKCDIQSRNISRAGSVWVGVDDNDTLAASKYCPLNFCKIELIQLKLQEKNSTSPDSQCNYKHSGILCGGCEPGLSLALGSEQCLHCSNAYISLILPFALAGVVLVLFLKVLDFTVCQGTINGLIFYANIISANKHLYYNQSDVNPITLFISWFNLDLGIETCFYDGLTAYVKTWLQFIFPIFIWCIAGAIIVLANYSKRVAAVSGSNGVPVLATLFLLSYAKLFNSIISILSVTTLYTTQGERLVWSVDGNVDYLGPKHAPLFVAALAALLFLWLPYTLFLLLGKYLHKINCRLMTRYLLKLKPFLDANYAPFQDHHQYWFGTILLIKAVILLSSATIPANAAHIVVFSIALSSFALTFWGHMVFKNIKTTLFHTSLFLHLGALNITKLFIFDSIMEMTTASYTLIGIVLVQFLGLCLMKIVNVFSSAKGSDGVNCCRNNREIEDDWEPYIQAAAQREQESGSDEDKESRSSGSIESLQTYPLL